MKLTEPELIEECEKEFIDTINAELDWDAIERLLLAKHKFVIQDEVDYKDGGLIVHNNEIAYKFDFEIKVPLSVIFNREGDCLEVVTLREEAEDDEAEAESEEIPVRQKDNPSNGSMASEIADMILEINQGEE